MLAIPKKIYHKPRKREGMSERHLEMIRQLPCVVTGRRPAEPHHLLKGPGVVRGMGMKSADKWAIPTHAEIHRAAHNAGNDFAYFEGLGITPTDLAKDLWEVTEDYEAMSRIVERYHRISRQHQWGLR